MDKTDPKLPELGDTISPGRVMDEQSTRVVDAVLYFVPEFRNPIKVVNSEGKTIGAATLTMYAGSLKMEFFLDPNTPEGFDIEVRTGRAKVKPQLTLDAEHGLDGVIVIE